MPETLPIEALKAAFPPAVEAGGFRLPALTLQHVFALGAIESPVMDDRGAPVTLRDMATAIALMLADPQALTPLIADALYGGDAAEKAKDGIRRMAIDLAARVPVERLPQAYAALQTQLAEAWASFVPMMPEGGGPLADRTGGQSAAAPASGRGPSS